MTPACWARARDRGRAYCISSSNHTFNRADFDFLVVALPEQDVWYVIPADAVHGVTTFRIHPTPSKRKKNSKDFEPYREAWHLLTGDEPGAWARYQRFTIHAGTE